MITSALSLFPTAGPISREFCGIRKCHTKSLTIVRGEEYESTYNTTIYLKEGDILIFEEEGRGYVKPVEEFVTVKEAIEELKCIEDL